MARRSAKASSCCTRRWPSWARATWVLLDCRATLLACRSFWLACSWVWLFSSWERLPASCSRLCRSRSSSWSSSNRPVRSRWLTSSISPSDTALIRLPVSTVITTAVCRGRRLNRLRRALPTRLPSRSPRVESTPPSTSSIRISSQPVTGFGDSAQYLPLNSFLG